MDVFVRSVLAGKNLGFPQARDSVIASEVSWAMLNHAIANIPPVRGTPEEMQQILEQRRRLVNGFGCLSECKNFPISRSLLSRFRLRMRPSAVNWLKHGRNLEISVVRGSSTVPRTARKYHRPERQFRGPVQFGGAGH